MDFDYSPRQQELMRRVSDFMDEHILPAVPIYEQQAQEGERWKVIPIVEDLKAKARKTGLWNMFMPPAFRRAARGRHLPVRGHPAHQHGICADLRDVRPRRLRQRGVQLLRARHRQHGGAQPLRHPGTEGAVAAPLMNGEIRSAFLMTEPAVASSDATNIETRIDRDGDDYVINGRKVVVLGRRRSALQGRHRHGQDQPQCRAPPAAVADPRAAGRAGREGGAHAAGVRLRRRARMATPRSCWKTSVSRWKALCSAKAAGSRSRRLAWVRAASITACAPSARPRWRWRRCAGG